MGKSKVLCHGLCLFDSETEQRALQFLHIYCSDVRSRSSAPEYCITKSALVESSAFSGTFSLEIKILCAYFCS